MNPRNSRYKTFRQHVYFTLASSNDDSTRNFQCHDNTGCSWLKISLVKHQRFLS